MYPPLHVPLYPSPPHLFFSFISGQVPHRHNILTKHGKVLTSAQHEFLLDECPDAKNIMMKHTLVSIIL